jgi:hypothetical protein
MFKTLLLVTFLTTAAAFAGTTVGDFKGGDHTDFGKRFRDPVAAFAGTTVGDFKGGDPTDFGKRFRDPVADTASLARAESTQHIGFIGRLIRQLFAKH